MYSDHRAAHMDWTDRESVLAAVQNSGYALRHAAGGLEADREVVLAAVLQDGCALAYASGAMKADREVVLAAFQQDRYALMYAAAALREDREFVKELLAFGNANDNFVWPYVSADIRRDKERLIFEMHSAGIKG